VENLTNKIMQEEKLSINEFGYDLPENKIAKFPLTQRDESKLLIYKQGKIEEDVFFI